MRAFQSAIIATAIALTACEGMRPTERGAVTGGAIGAAAGALIGNDPGSAALGALVAGGIGWYLGCREEGRCGNVDNRRQYQESGTGRYYFHDEQSDQWFYENGEPYTGPRPR